jgi:Heavy metal associated domain 2
MSADAAIVHQLPGRLRLRIVDRKGDSWFFEKLKNGLERCSAIRQLDINPTTGSVLIHHDGNADEILKYGGTHDLFVLAPPAGRRTVPPSRAAVHALRTLDSRVKERTSGSWDLRELAFFTLSLGALVQTARRNFWPEALTLIWYAMLTLQQTAPIYREEKTSRNPDVTRP